GVKQRFSSQQAYLQLGRLFHHSGFKTHSIAWNGCRAFYLYIYSAPLVPTFPTSSRAPGVFSAFRKNKLPGCSSMDAITNPVILILEPLIVIKHQLAVGLPRRSRPCPPRFLRAPSSSSWPSTPSCYSFSANLGISGHFTTTVSIWTLNWKNR
ncbi:hypothetical protein T310_8886, partial [Rasamsonia emersonii CBS 393.64]